MGLERKEYPVTMSSREVVNKQRVLFLAGFILLILLLYVYKLFDMQIVDNMIYQNQAKAVSLRSNVIPAQRGKIFDRSHDVPLAMNVDSFAVTYVSAEGRPEGRDDMIRRLADLLGSPIKEIARKFPPPGSPSYQAFEIADGVSFDTIIRIAENMEDFPGIHWNSKPRRFYNFTGSISHVLGYVGNITNEELQVLYNQGYTSASVLGKSGVERQYDHLLRGENGRIFNTVDVKGRRMSEKGHLLPPENGYDLVLTIDRKVQELAEKALGPRKGAVVVLKPDSGEILALVSYPGFNPNRFNEKGPYNFGALTLNSDFPFLNRAIQSSYAPASTFKVLLAGAILEKKAFNPGQSINCEGSMRLGNRIFHCHKRSGHGRLNLEEALGESCNIYFGTVGVEHLGISTIAEFAHSFGLGALTGVDLQGEVEGNIPSPAWKKQSYNSIWTGGDTLNVTVGQGFTTVTPLQMADVIAAIANGGKIFKPHILKAIIDPADQTVVEKIEPELLRETLVNPDNMKILRNYMRSVITRGTAKVVILNDQVKVAGKTGTGEVGLKENWHSWFASYAPWSPDNKGDKIVVVTMVEASNKWDWWAPKAADIIYQGYFGNMTYEQTIRYMKKRRIWYAGGMELEEDDEN